MLRQKQHAHVKRTKLHTATSPVLTPHAKVTTKSKRSPSSSPILSPVLSEVPSTFSLSTSPALLTTISRNMGSDAGERRQRYPKKIDQEMSSNFHHNKRSTAAKVINDAEESYVSDVKSDPIRPRFNQNSHNNNYNTNDDHIATDFSSQYRKKSAFYSNSSANGQLQFSSEIRPKYVKAAPTNTNVEQLSAEEQLRTMSLLNLKNYEKYREIAKIVTQGDRGQVYEWLSTKSNRIQVDVSSPDVYGSTLIAQSAKKHFYGVALTLLPFLDVNQPSSQGPAIFHSLAVADLFIMRALLDYGADPNLRGPGEQTPLMIASCIDNTSFIQYLILKGANVNLQDSKGRTAIMYAVKKCTPQIAKYLYQCGANPFLRDSTGRNAYDYAMERSNDMSLPPTERKNALYLANIFKQPPETIRLPPPITKMTFAHLNDPTHIHDPIDFKSDLAKYNSLVDAYGIDHVIVLPDGQMVADIDSHADTYKQQLIKSYQTMLQSFQTQTKDELRYRQETGQIDANPISKQRNNHDNFTGSSADVSEIPQDMNTTQNTVNGGFDPNSYLNKLSALIQRTQAKDFNPVTNQSARFGLDDKLKSPSRQAQFSDKKAITTVYHDILQRYDFSMRHTEHVDQRYKEWYKICRNIHIHEDVERKKEHENLKKNVYVSRNNKAFVADEPTGDLKAYTLLGLSTEGLDSKSYYDRVRAPATAAAKGPNPPHFADKK